MASSGWQGQKDIQTSKYPHMALNLNVWDVVHSGTTLTFKATVRAVVTSGNIYYNGVSVSLTGGGSISKNMNPVSTGGYVDFGTYNCTVTGVSTGTTSYEVTATLSAGSTASGSARWTLDIGSSGTPPTGGYITFNSSTWNTINATSGVTSWGSTPGRIHAMVVTGNTNGDANNLSSWHGARREFFYDGTSNLSHTFAMTTASTSQTYDGNPLELKGMLHYKLGCYNINSGDMSTDAFVNTLRYLPPAPGQLAYSDPGGGGSKTYPVSFTGVVANNHTTYDSASLTRTIRYKIDNGNWVYVDNATVAAIDFVTNFNVAIPAASTATVEAWMTYHGEQSEVVTVAISNTNQGCALYGSVSGQTKKLGPVYASVNGQTKKLVKIYASVNGVTKKVYEDV